MPSLEQITSVMLEDTRSWPMVTHLCVKRRGIIMERECGPDGIVVRNHVLGAEMYGGPFEEKFDNADSLISAGWVVD